MSDGISHLCALLGSAELDRSRRSRPDPDDPMSYLPGPWFVGCVVSDCQANVFGPVPTWEGALVESGDICQHAHLISTTVAESTHVNAPCYTSGGRVQALENWRLEHNERAYQLRMEREGAA